MVTVHIEYDSIMGGTNTFHESFSTPELALAYLSGYIGAFPMNITSFEVTQ